MTERYADGLAGDEELRAEGAPRRAWAAARKVAQRAAGLHPWSGGRGTPRHNRAERPREQEEQATLLRCIVGPAPWRPVQVAPAVLAHNGGTARRLAEALHSAHSFGDLPVLADLLEEAGVTDAELLGHLRGPGLHVLGCHALDTVLGKS